MSHKIDQGDYAISPDFRLKTGDFLIKTGHSYPPKGSRYSTVTMTGFFPVSIIINIIFKK